MRGIELYAGSGVISAALRRHGVQMTTVDLHTPADVQVDIQTWYPPPADFVWASPPCPEFTASSMPWHAKWKCPPSLAHVDASLRCIKQSGARFWCLENVRGSIPWIGSRLGVPQCFGAIALWHNLPRPIEHYVYFWKQRESGRFPGKRNALPGRFASLVAAAVVEALSAPVWEVQHG